MLPWTPFALRHHSYIGLDRAGERKKGNLGCKTNRVVPKPEKSVSEVSSSSDEYRGSHIHFNDNKPFRQLNQVHHTGWGGN
jgi:hypothetical protein